MLTVKTIEHPLLTTQCRKRLVEASHATHEGWTHAIKEDGGLYDYVDAYDVSRLLSTCWQVYRVFVEQ